MSSFGQVIGEAVKFSICSVLKGAGQLESWAREILDPNDPNFQYRSRLIYSNYCEDPPPPPSSPPFSGGQCEFCYTVRIQWTQTGSANPAFDSSQDVTYNVWGEISGITVEKTFPTQGSPGASRPRIGCYGDCGLGRLPSPTIVGTFQAPVDDETVITVTSITVTPRDGQPDNCGQPPYNLPPDNPPDRQFPIDFTFTYEDGTDFNITGNVFFGFAYINNNFDLNIPLKFVLNNNVKFNADFNFKSGDINFNFGDDYDYPSPAPPEGDYDIDPVSPSPPPTSVPPPESYPPPFPPNEEPDAEDPEDFPDDSPKEAPLVRRIIGVLVDTQIAPPMPSQIDQDVNPVVYAPDIGLVNFAYNIGGTRLYWGEDIRVKNRRQVIFTPEGRYAVAVEGTIRKGGQWTLTPIYARVPSESVATA